MMNCVGHFGGGVCMPQKFLQLSRVLVSKDPVGAWEVGALGQEQEELGAATKTNTHNQSKFMTSSNRKVSLSI